MRAIADRYGVAATLLTISALALAGMTTLGVHTAYFWSALWLFVVGVGLGGAAALGGRL